MTMTLIAVVVVALFFDFTNGFHDTANSIATSVSTRAMSPRAAVLSAAVLNVLGAGDAFASGMIWGVRRGLPLDRAVRMGNAVGAIVVTRHGCANFMPTMPEIESFTAGYGGLD